MEQEEEDRTTKKRNECAKLKQESNGSTSTEVIMPTAESKLTPYETRVVPTRREDLVKFLLLPPYRGVNKRIRCYIKRTKSRLSGKSTYSLWLEPSDGGPSRCLMYAGKKGKKDFMCALCCVHLSLK